MAALGDNNPFSALSPQKTRKETKKKQPKAPKQEEKPKHEDKQKTDKELSSQGRKKNDDQGSKKGGGKRAVPDVPPILSPPSAVWPILSPSSANVALPSEKNEVFQSPLLSPVNVAPPSEKKASQSSVSAPPKKDAFQSYVYRVNKCCSALGRRLQLVPNMILAVPPGPNRKHMLQQFEDNLTNSNLSDVINTAYRENLQLIPGQKAIGLVETFRGPKNVFFDSLDEMVLVSSKMTHITQRMGRWCKIYKNYNTWKSEQRQKAALSKMETQEQSAQEGEQEDDDEGDEGDESEEEEFNPAPKPVAEKGPPIPPKPDTWEALSIFASLSQELEDAKVIDLRWFLTILAFSSLAQYIHTDELLYYWPKHLRNAYAHSQINLNVIVSAYNLPQKNQQVRQDDQQAEIQDEAQDQGEEEKGQLCPRS